MTFANFQVLLIFLVFENSIDFLQYNRIKIFSYNQNFSETPFSLPVELQIDRKIIDYQIDRYKKCVYYLVEIGILRKCFGGDHFWPNFEEEFILYKTKIKGMFLDVMANYLYYFKFGAVFVLNLDNRREKTICLSKYIIEKMAIFPKFGFYFF